MRQRVADPHFRSLAAGFLNVIPRLTFWGVMNDIADGYSIGYEYHTCTFSWDGSGDAPPAGSVAVELFEDREILNTEDFLKLIRQAIESEIDLAPSQHESGMELLDRISRRLVQA